MYQTYTSQTTNEILQTVLPTIIGFDSTNSLPHNEAQLS